MYETENSLFSQHQNRYPLGQFSFIFSLLATSNAKSKQPRPCQVRSRRHHPRPQMCQEIAHAVEALSVDENHEIHELFKVVYFAWTFTRLATAAHWAVLPRIKELNATQEKTASPLLDMVEFQRTIHHSSRTLEHHTAPCGPRVSALCSVTVSRSGSWETTPRLR